ncbi:MAG: hypothetical protein L0H22_00170 [Brevibacterium aurantiacum]|nr:hypothetical protein [Brevibacterium aurantiacum]
MADVQQFPESIAELVPKFHVLKLPMVTRFRSITEREVMLFEGPDGWAEFSPFTEYGSVESSRWLQAALEFAVCCRLLRLSPAPSDLRLKQSARVLP